MRILVSLLTIAASIYFLLGMMIYLLQERMVFLSKLPGRELIASPADIGLHYENVSFTSKDGETLHGWYIPASDSSAVLLFFHGNAGNISHRLDSIRIFNELGLDVLIIDYRGYGQSTGKASEQGTYLDALAAWNYLVTTRRVAAERIIVFGRSLGGAIGAWLGTQRQPSAVIIESSFSSGPDMARRLYPFFPTRLLTRLKYPVAEYASHLNCPVLVLHSRQDEIIPFAMGQEIYAAVKQDKQFVELRGDHNNGFMISQPEYTVALKNFIQAIVSQ